MAHHRGPKTITQDLVFHYDTGNEKSFVGEPTSNVYTLLGSSGFGSASDNLVNFPIQGGTGLIRLGHGQTFGGYTISPNDVVYKYNLGNYGCHYHGMTTTIPSGVYLTFSFQYFLSTGLVVENTSLANVENYGNGALSGGISVPNSTTGVWHQASFTVGPTSSSGTQAMFIYPGGCGGRLADSGYILYKNPQVEFKNHKTPFTNGTRSNTQGLIDLSRNRTISISGVSFDSNAMMLFDGTDDAIPITAPPNFSGSGSWTMNTWFKINGAPSSTAYMNVIVDMDPTGGSANMICVNWSDMMLQYRSRPVGGSYTTINGSVLSQNVWYNATAVKYGTNETKLFLNGVQDGGTYSGNLPAGNQSFFNIGRWTDGTVYANATIPIVSIYNRALTPDEVYRNYMSLKSRFGL